MESSIWAVYGPDDALALRVRLLTETHLGSLLHGVRRWSVFQQGPGLPLFGAGSSLRLWLVKFCSPSSSDLEAAKQKQALLDDVANDFALAVPREMKRSISLNGARGGRRGWSRHLAASAPSGSGGSDGRLGVVDRPRACSTR